MSVYENRKSNLRWIDPPAGWKYGFPKLWNGEGDLTEWLVSKGYPKREIARLGAQFPVRQWEPSVEDDTED